MLESLTADFRHMTATWDGPPRKVWLRAAPRIVVNGRFRTVLWFRASAALHRRGWQFLALYVQSRGQRATGGELHPAAVIGPGMNLVHGSGVVVGHEVVAGTDLVMYQSVTLGHGRQGAGQPRLGDRVRIFAGASLLGPISVGDDVVVGAHALVLADVPSGTRVVGLWNGR